MDSASKWYLKPFNFELALTLKSYEINFLDDSTDVVSSDSETPTVNLPTPARSSNVSTAEKTVDEGIMDSRAEMNGLPVLDRLVYVHNRLAEQAKAGLNLSEGFRLGLKHRRAELEKLIKKTHVVFSELDSLEHLLRATKSKVDDIRLELVQELLNHDSFYAQTKKRDGHLDFCLRLTDVNAVDMLENWETLNTRIRTLELENSSLRQQAYLNVSFALFFEYFVSFNISLFRYFYRILYSLRKVITFENELRFHRRFQG